MVFEFMFGFIPFTSIYKSTDWWAPSGNYTNTNAKFLNSIGKYYTHICWCCIFAAFFLPNVVFWCCLLVSRGVVKTLYWFEKRFVF